MNIKSDDTLGVIFGDPVEGASEMVTPGANELVIFLGGADVEREERERMPPRHTATPAGPGSGQRRSALSR